jgi:hypothetical protein
VIANGLLSFYPIKDISDWVPSRRWLGECAMAAAKMKIQHPPALEHAWKPTESGF